LFKYEMHCHTAECSKCAKINAEDLVRFYYDMGFSGICITDHFLNGNTTVPKDAPWNSRVSMFMEGYNRAKTTGDKLGIDVFPAWEYSYRGTDFLTYGLDEEWLHRNPDCLDWKVSEYCDRVHADGGIIVQAHPFREAYYIEMIRLMPRHVDAVETINANRTDFENEMADKYADAYNILKTAGSDNHTGKQERLAVVEFDRKMNSLGELLKAMLNGEGKNRLYTLTPDA
jgi:histidinol phosphatase-like PHP family hydrolase